MPSGKAKTNKVILKAFLVLAVLSVLFWASYHGRSGDIPQAFAQTPPPVWDYIPPTAGGLGDCGTVSSKAQVLNGGPNTRPEDQTDRHGNGSFDTIVVTNCKAYQVVWGVTDKTGQQVPGANGVYVVNDKYDEIDNWVDFHEREYERHTTDQDTDGDGIIDIQAGDIVVDAEANAVLKPSQAATVTVYAFKFEYSNAKTSGGGTAPPLSAKEDYTLNLEIHPVPNAPPQAVHHHIFNIVAKLGGNLWDRLTRILDPRNWVSSAFSSVGKGLAGILMGGSCEVMKRFMTPEERERFDRSDPDGDGVYDTEVTNWNNPEVPNANGNCKNYPRFQGTEAENQTFVKANYDQLNQERALAGLPPIPLPAKYQERAYARSVLDGPDPRLRDDASLVELVSYDFKHILLAPRTVFDKNLSLQGLLPTIGLNTFEGLIIGTPAALTYERGIVLLGWSLMMNVTAIVLVIIIMWIGLSQIIRSFLGSRNMATWRELIPRLILAIVAALTSYWWCSLLIDVADAISRYIAAGMDVTPADIMLIVGQLLTALFAASAFSMVAGLVPIAGWIVLFANLGFILIGVFLMKAFLIMLLLVLGQFVMRIILINFFIIVSPLALILWALPETSGWGRRWLSLFTTTLFQHGLQLIVLAIGIWFVKIVTPLGLISQTGLLSPQLLTHIPTQSIFAISLGIMALVVTYKIPSMLGQGSLQESFVSTLALAGIGLRTLGGYAMGGMGPGGPGGSLIGPGGVVTSPVGSGPSANLASGAAIGATAGFGLAPAIVNVAAGHVAGIVGGARSGIRAITGRGGGGNDFRMEGGQNLDISGQGRGTGPRTTPSLDSSSPTRVTPSMGASDMGVSGPRSVAGQNVGSQGPRLARGIGDQGDGPGKVVTPQGPIGQWSSVAAGSSLKFLSLFGRPRLTSPYMNYDDWSGVRSSPTPTSPSSPSQMAGAPAPTTPRLAGQPRSMSQAHPETEAYDFWTQQGNIGTQGFGQTRQAVHESTAPTSPTSVPRGPDTDGQYRQAHTAANAIMGRQVERQFPQRDYNEILQNEGTAPRLASTRPSPQEGQASQQASVAGRFHEGRVTQPRLFDGRPLEKQQRDFSRAAIGEYGHKTYQRMKEQGAQIVDGPDGPQIKEGDSEPRDFDGSDSMLMQRLGQEGISRDDFAQQFNQHFSAPRRSMAEADRQRQMVADDGPTTGGQPQIAEREARPDAEQPPTTGEQPQIAEREARPDEEQPPTTGEQPQIAEREARPDEEQPSTTGESRWQEIGQAISSGYRGGRQSFRERQMIGLMQRNDGQLRVATAQENAARQAMGDEEFASSAGRRIEYVGEGAKMRDVNNDRVVDMRPEHIEAQHVLGDSQFSQNLRTSARATDNVDERTGNNFVSYRDEDGKIGLRVANDGEQALIERNGTSGFNRTFEGTHEYMGQGYYVRDEGRVRRATEGETSLINRWGTDNKGIGDFNSVMRNTDKVSDEQGYRAQDRSAREQLRSVGGLLGSAGRGTGRAAAGLGRTLSERGITSDSGQTIMRDRYFGQTYSQQTYSQGTFRSEDE